MPNARYTFGLTVFPDWPTWRAAGIQPASTSGRETPSVAPIAAASSSNCVIESFSPTPRPIESRKSAFVMSTSPSPAASTYSRWRLAAGSAGDRELATRAAEPAPSAGAHIVGRIIRSTRSWPGSPAPHAPWRRRSRARPRARRSSRRTATTSEAKPSPSRAATARARSPSRSTVKPIRTTRRLALGDERLEGARVRIGRELLRFDGDGRRSRRRPDDSRRRPDEPGSRAITATVTGPSRAPAAAETHSSVTSLSWPRDVLGYDQSVPPISAAFPRRSALIRCATSAGSSPSISAPSPRGGTNIRRTRRGGLGRDRRARPPRSPSARPA